MSKRIASAFKDGDFVVVRMSAEAADWLKGTLLDQMPDLRKQAKGGRSIDQPPFDYATEIVGTLSCELDEWRMML